MRMRRTIRLGLGCLLVAALAGGPGVSPASFASKSASKSKTRPSKAGIRFGVHPTGFSGGEPTLAVLEDGTILAQAMEHTVRSTDGGKTWADVHVPVSGGVTLDPYIHADAETERILASQLLGACQMLSISDDGGDTWQDLPQACPAGDHQKIGSGPWTNPALGMLHSSAFYTCQNDVGDTACAMSLDGGLTWLPPVVVFPGIDPTADDGVNGVPGFCGGLEGDPVSGPDGTIYLPREYCGRPFLGVSTDDGATWSTHWVAEPARTLPIAFGGNNPSVTVDKAGTVYYAWTGADWRHYISSSTDQGVTWSKPVVVSPKGGSTTFPTIIAGKKGAVATAFIGTSDSAEGPDAAPEEARWYLHASYSLNADSPKAKWKTSKVSNDVLQIGCVGRHGALCGQGNLLDFIDTAWTPQGRLAIVYPDGCIEECAKKEDSTSSLVTVAVQTSGPRFR